MGLVFNTNVSAVNTARHLDRSHSALSSSMARLSSGLRVNSAADDAAGLGISETIRAQVRGFSQARLNAANGTSVLQTADGALSELNAILGRMKELSVQAADGALSTGDRSKLNNEFGQLRTELDRIVDSTEFNGTALLNGGMATGMTFQVGNNNTANDRIAVSIADTGSDQIGSSASTARLNDATLSTVTGARNALDIVEDAIDDVSDRRATIGASQNRLSVTMNNLATMIESLKAADSRIRDADIASETAAYTKNQILVQAGVSVLSQANQLPSLALSLLG
jgi:flagellin